MNISDEIKSGLPPNIQVGGKVINTGKIIINGKELPSIPEADVTKEQA